VDNPGIINDAAIHRIMANTKEELMKNNELIETCSWLVDMNIMDLLLSLN